MKTSSRVVELILGLEGIAAAQLGRMRAGDEDMVARCDGVDMWLSEPITADKGTDERTQTLTQTEGHIHKHTHTHTHPCNQRKLSNGNMTMETSSTDQNETYRTRFLFVTGETYMFI